MSPATSSKDAPGHGREQLFLGEQWWASRWSWLKGRGYTLRPRYHPNWKPSWKVGKVDARKYEDGQLPNFNSNIMDATARDGTFVTLKRIDLTRHPQEVEISVMLSSPELAKDPRNHSVRITEVLEDVPDASDTAILVMPLLSKIDAPFVETIGEFVAFYTQILEGLQFIHERHIAHCDFYGTNVMMDSGPLYPVPFHPRKVTRRRDWKGKVRPYTRTERPVKYYIIDYGLSHRFKPDEPAPLIVPIIPGDKSVPEHQGMKEFEASDPFATDIYTAGNLVNEWFVKRAAGFDFMRPLISDMTQDDPAKRPKIDEVVRRFSELRASLDTKQLRSRVRDKWTIYPSFAGLRFWMRKMNFTLSGTPPIPDPRT
ncbi:unnamed protein product [Peniophora sp. CBMAI 1063]|nr:unnamed protein product [Peniophora sp. CBMAI 1063]